MRINYHGKHLPCVDEQNEGTDQNSQSSTAHTNSCDDEERPFLRREHGNSELIDYNSGRQSTLSMMYSSDGEDDDYRSRTNSGGGGGETSTTQTIHSSDGFSDAWLSASPVKKVPSRKSSQQVRIGINFDSDDEEDDDDDPTFYQDKDDDERAADRVKAQEMSKLLRKEMKKKKKKKKKHHHKKDKSDKERILDIYESLEQDRKFLMEKWKQEFKEEQERERNKRFFRRVMRFLDDKSTKLFHSIQQFLIGLEIFVCNLPLTVGAVAIAWVTMGVDWWKYMEEMTDNCTPVHFRSVHCTFPEFPGCFECKDLEDHRYKAALYHHYFCDTFAAILLVGFFAKCVLAWEIVADELKNPTTSTPCGLVLITTCIIAAGRGVIGEAIVLLASVAHLLLFGWFFYMAFKYHLLPDPSWGPNTVGICYPAVKSWLYYGVPGDLLMFLCLGSFTLTFPISVLRAWLNRKMSANVAWIQMSGPAVALYALTLMTQPTYENQRLIETDPQKALEYQTWHLKHIMPIFHTLFVCCLIGSISSVVGLWQRWDSFKQNPFSPAHAAFCFPILSHANAVQAYRGVVNSLLKLPADHWFLKFIYWYWFVFLVGGSIVTVTVTAAFLYYLPTWTTPNVEGEEQPPAPDETDMTELLMTGEHLVQPFISPTVLQANETGVLMRVRRDDAAFATRGRYVRTLMVQSLGFEPKLDRQTVAAEREELLDWVAKHPPIPRHNRINSNPAQMYGSTYDSSSYDPTSHRRMKTMI